MNQTLYQLAYQNIKKYKKHYIFITIVVLMLSTLYMSVVIGYSSFYDAKKAYHQDMYGTWYFYTETNDENQKDFINEANAKKANYGFWVDQGFSDDGLSIGHVSKELYELCHLKLVEGRYPKNDHEIMISSQVAKSHPLHTKLSLPIMDREIQDYEIVGIIQNSQGIFPNIYTNFKEGITTKIVSDTLLGVHNIEYDLYELQYEDDEGMPDFYQFEPVFNEFGYDANESMGYVNQMSSQLLFFAEVILCIVVVLIAVTSTSLNRRSKEFALLRGIGMTSRQLFIMIVYENAITILLSLFSGMIVSFGIVYMVMLYLETIYHHFIYHIDIPTILLYFIILLSCIMLSTMFPIFSSAKRSLSGTFDSEQFKYIQVRYRKLKKQTCFAIAKREMRVYKKTSIFLICLFSFLSILYTFSFMTSQVVVERESLEFQSFHYVEFQFDKDKVEEVKKMENTSIYRIKDLDESSRFNYQDYEDLKGIYNILSLDHREDFEKCKIEGRLPENKNEILIGENVDLCEEIIDENQIERNIITHLKINDIISIHGQDYTVVGKILSNEELSVKDSLTSSIVFGLCYVPCVDIVVLPELFNELDGELELLGRRYYDDRNQEEEIMNELSQNSYLYDLNSSDSIVYDIVFTSDSYNFMNLQINPYLLILPVIVAFIFSYFLNKNDMINHEIDYALFYLIGMTKKDMLKKQLCKAIRMTYIILIIIVVWIALFDLYLQVLRIPVVEVLFMVCTIFIISLVIYCLPLYRLWKEKTLLPFYDN